MSGLSPSCPGPRARLDWRKYRSCPRTPGQARRYSLSERARARTVVAGARSCWLGLGVTSSRGYVSVCPCVRPAHTIFPRSRLLFPRILMTLISPQSTGLNTVPMHS